MPEWRRPAPSTLPVVLLAIASWTTACNGKPCTDPPDWAEADEELKEQLDDLLDEADAYDAQRERTHKLSDGLGQQRQKSRLEREALRDKLIDELVAVAPDPTAFAGHIDAMHDTIMDYAQASAGAALTAHRMFTTEQREEIAEQWDTPPKDYDGSWTVNRGIELALLKIDATTQQETLVWSWRDKMVTATDALYKSQNKIRQRLLLQWRSPKPNPNAVRKDVAAAGEEIRVYVQYFGKGAMEITEALTPKQRMYTNSQVNRMRRCPK